MELAEFERRVEALREAQAIFVLASRVHVWGATVRDEPTREHGDATFTVTPEEAGGWRADEWYSETGGTHSVGRVSATSAESALDWVWWRATREYFKLCVVPSELQYDRTQLRIYDILSNVMTGQSASAYRQMAQPAWADVTTSSTELDRAARADAPAAVAVRIARNPLTPGASLTRMIEHPFASVRWQLAGNPSTPPDALDLLKADSDFGVRWYLSARADAATNDVIAWAREDSALWSAVLERPDASAADLEYVDVASSGSLHAAVIEHANARST